jgi:hemolysin activation/secretion protein
VRGDRGISATWLALSACLWFAASAATLSGAYAQLIPSTVAPGRERFQFEGQPTPRAEPAGPRVNLLSTVAPEGADKIKLVIRAVEIEGATVFTPEQLKPLYQGLIGQTVSLLAVYDLAQRITAKYGAAGYVLSRAIVPPQDLASGGATVRIQVVEGYVDKVVWPPALSSYRDYFTYYAQKIIADRPSNVRTIERYLLLAGDLPGLKFSTSLKASEANPNAATLFVEVTEKHVDALARVDNRGTPQRGPLEYLATVTANNLFGQQDALTVTYASVDPSRELIYVGGGYRQVLTAEGLAAFVNASDGFGRPGTEQLEQIRFKTKTSYVDSGLSYPVIRARESNLTLTALVFGSDSSSIALDKPFNDDRLRGGRFKVDADMADPWRGINLFNLTVSQGVNGLGATENGNPLASRADGRVDFTKIEMLATRIQPLGGPFSLYLAAYGQFSGTSLLTPEQCSYGGRFFGRAYDPSQLLADSCIMGNGELRFDIPTYWQQNFPAYYQLSQAQLYAFVDGADMYDHVPDVVGTPKWLTAASVGGGLRLGWLTNVSADFTVAKAVSGPRNDTRGFFSVTAKY